MSIIGPGGSTLSTALSRESSDLRFLKDTKATLDIKRIELCFLRGVVDNDPFTLGLPKNKESTPENETEIALGNLKQFAKEHFGINPEEYNTKLYVPSYDATESEIEAFQKMKGDPEGKFNVQRELMRVQNMIFALNIEIDGKDRKVKQLQSTLENEGNKI